jgi:preprotein translocase subunit SecD
MLYFPRWKTILITLVCAVGVVFAFPNLLSREAAESMPRWLPHQQIVLGLDLQGGSHLVLEVETGVVLRERLTALVDETRVRLRGEMKYTGLGIVGDAVNVRPKEPTDVERAIELLDGIDPDVLIAATPEGVVTLTFGETAISTIRDSAVTQSLEIVRRRIDETGTREPTIQRQGPDRILVQLPGIDNPDRIKDLLGKTAKLNFHLVDTETSVGEARQGRLPPGSMLVEADDERDVSGELMQYVVRKRVSVSGDRLVDAQPTFQTNQPVVSFRFDGVGGRKFGDITVQNIGRPLAIILDNKVISAPVIRSPITGGSGVIEGNFTVREATDLALLLRAGALPAPLTILEERSVGPDLGADSVQAGKLAAMIGLFAVIVFMVVSYGLFGLVADVALLINILLLAAALSLLQATLTLPGIAGIVLTIGMAVDANVLVFERIREEVANGRTPFSAVDAGYQRALTTIIDSNVTTLIAAVLLFGLGSGPVKGFGVTLAIGICTSMFSAVMVTRMMVVLWLKQRRPKLLPI